MEKKVRIPVYQKIALDIASKIVEHKYIIGEKIYTRSTIASQYNVSSETARRAISILSDLDIVETIKGSGVTIKSYEKALKFVREFKDMQTFNSLIADINDNISQQKEVNINLENKIKRLVKIRTTTPYLNKNISDINFWHHTTATVIAIKRDNSIILSPGPYADFQENDIFYLIGDEDSYRRVMEFLYPEEKSSFD